MITTSLQDLPEESVSHNAAIKKNEQHTSKTHQLEICCISCSLERSLIIIIEL
ncbi:hypothetical protein [Nostoc sp.]|uniref:hypothetical protein n=1 Tax=Nostoc sp. TaxID=1180 RepID=UPI002FFC6725